MTETITLPPCALTLISIAEQLPKSDYRAYSECKRTLNDLRLEPPQYDMAHHELVRIFEI